MTATRSGESELTVPSRTMTSRSAYAATRGSWVTSTTVVPSLARSGRQQVHDLLAGERVQRSGRLVGEQHLGPATSPRASATRWAWPPDSSPDRRRSQPSSSEPVEPARGLGERLGAADAAEQQRQRDVLLGGQLGNELAELEHEAESVPAQRAALGLAHRVEALAGEVDLAARRARGCRPGSAAGSTCRSRSGP